MLQLVDRGFWATKLQLVEQGFWATTLKLVVDWGFWATRTLQLDSVVSFGNCLMAMILVLASWMIVP